MTCNSSDLPPLDGDANITAQEITIYPNPVDDWFRIVVKGFEPEELLRLRILKMDGTVVYSREMGIERELDLSTLSLQNSAGTLLVEISGESHKSTSRIVRIGK